MCCYTDNARFGAATNRRSMNIERIQIAWRHAQQAADQLGTYSPSLDALFVVAYMEQERPAALNSRKTTDEPPEWFRQHVAKLGDRFATASDVLAMAGAKDTSPSQARQCGIWLRAMGFESFKSNGQTKFKIRLP